MASDTQYGLTPAASPVAANPYGLEPGSNAYGLQSVYAQMDQKYGLTPAIAQPAHDPAALLFPTGSGVQIGAAPEASIWDRIKQAVTAGIPNYSSRTVYNPKYGQMQLVSPEEAMTPAEQRAHPMLTGAGEFAGGLTSPQSAALLAGTGGLGELPGAAAMLPRLMSAGFGAQTIYSGVRNVPAIRDAWNRGDASEVERLLTHIVLNLGMGALAGQHAVTGAGAVSSRTQAETETPAGVPDSSTAEGVKAHNQALARAKQELGPRADVRAVLARAQTILTEPTSPLGEVLQEQAPHVRVTDSSAAARDLLEKDTVLRPPDINLREYGVSDPALAELEKQMRGRAGEIVKKYPVKPIGGVEPEAQARVAEPADIAAFRRPSARVVSDDHIPVVSRDEILSQGISNIVSNSDELQRAGVDPSAIRTSRDVDAALQRASDVIKSNLDPRAEATISFEAQKQLAADLNMSVEELLARRGGEAFNTEQALAARALLTQSAKQVVELSKVAAKNGDAESLNAATTALAQHQAIAEKVAGITAEAGRALGGFRIGQAALPEVKIANVLSKLSPEAQAEAALLLSKFDPSDPATVRQVNQFAEKIKPSTTLDKLFEYYRNSLLSSPHTLIVKTASELSIAAMEATKKAVAGGISADRFSSEAYWYAKGMAQALAEHAKPVLSGEFQLEGSPGFERANTQAIKGRLGSIVRAPGEAMSRMTNLMYAGNYFGELNSLAARQALSEGLAGHAFHARQEYLAHHPTEEMSEAAHALATRNTFQSQLGAFGEKIGQAIATKPSAPWLPESVKSIAPLKFLFPFYRTPVNLFKATLTQATPYELLNGIAKGDTDAMARGIVGSAISASLASLALSGHLTGGGPTDYKKEETLRATGWQPYSVKIGNKYYSYRRFEPVGLAAGLIADAVHGAQHGDSEVVAQSKADTAVKHIMRNLDDFPFLGTLANLLQAVHDPVGGRAQSFINREAGSIVPAGVANIAETVDPTVRRPQTAGQAIQSRIPGLTQAAPAIIDVTGSRVQRPLNNLGGANPFPFTTAKSDPIVDELARLGISTPQPPTQIKWKGKPTPLSDSERQEFAQQEGQELYRRVSKLIQSGAWQRRSDDQKRKALVELQRMLDESRPKRLTKMRRQAQSELARSSL